MEPGKAFLAGGYWRPEASLLRAWRARLAEAPALFGMGAPESPTVIWHWKAVELKSLDETLEVLPPHVTGSGWSTTP